ncbi:MAG: phosphomannomutase/phosphoglucomutase [Candidatus Hydrothermales bacterium]
MIINPYIFREYDIRGIAEEDLRDESVWHIGKAIASYIIKRGGKTISLGRDARISSPRIHDVVLDAFLKSGVNVIDIGMVPTPLLYFSVFHFGLDGGVQITGSHNPKEFNGIKIMCGKETIYGKEIQKIKEIIERGEYVEGHGKKWIREDVIFEYIREIKERVRLWDPENYEVAVDPGNGTCGPVIEELYRELKIKFTGIYMEPNGHFPNHLPDPTVEKYMEDLKNLMKKENRFTCGFGFDGDGDRLGVIDDKFRIIYGDKILAILSKKVLEEKKGSKIIFDVKSSQGVYEYIKSLGGDPIIWKTGHSLIKAKLKEENAPIAGEMSGHLFFKDRFYGFDDAIYASLRFLEVVDTFRKKVSELVDEIPFYYSTPEIRVECPDEHKFKVVEKLKKKFSKKFKILDIDGVRINFPDGFGLVRASNTQPVLVLRFEGKTPEKMEEIKNIILEELSKFSEVNLGSIP